jgi:5'(3')-deoxyribonucleotidase
MALRIGVDLDGVVYPFDEVFLEYCVARGLVAREQIKPANRVDFFVDYGLSLGTFFDLCEQGIAEQVIFLQGDPYPGAREALAELKSLGSVHIITHRLMPGAAQTTADWCRSHGIEYDSIHFDSNKTCVETDYMIEDNIDNYDDLDNYGCIVYLLNRPWNQVDDNRRRVDSLDEFVEAVKNDVGNKSQKVESRTS